jgi:ferredoxin/protein involved in ribonucleotide reduction
MKYNSLKIIYFSATNTTKTIVEEISKQIKIETKIEIDITKQQNRLKPIKCNNDEILIIGIPVYMGRVPAIVSDYLKAIELNNNPVICIAVYGNRTYGDALLELSDILTDKGAITIAGGAFIGEHSFSSKELPIAESRPNNNDLIQARDFGNQINKKLSTETLLAIELPGEFPYGGITKLWDVDFIAISENCIDNGICYQVCPTGAIDTNDYKKIDIKKCISCCACIKACPVNARSIKESQVKDAAIRLNKLFKEPKQPEIFI